MNENKISEELLSVITAVAIAATGKPVKIKKVTFLDYKKRNIDWALVARMCAMQNHNITTIGE